jgi:hypothetical protein
MYSTPSSSPSWRPSGPIPPGIGIYPAKRNISYRAIGALAAFLMLLALAFTVYLLLTGGQQWPAR